MQQKFLINVRLNNLTIETFYYYFFLKSKTRYKRSFEHIHEFFQQAESKHTKALTFYCFDKMFTLDGWHDLEIQTINILMKDLINLNSIWRLAKGYGTHGQRTHSNNKKIKKNRLLHTFRLNQFFSLFGYRKRNIYPTLIICEYTNKLWYKNWFFEWLQAQVFSIKLVKNKVKQVPIDPVKLAKNFTNGYIRVGKAAKIGKSKKITKVATIGLPIFFSRWLYNEFPPRSYPYKLWISDSDRRKMGVKRKKNKKK